MKSYGRWMAALASLAVLAGMTTAPGWAGRVSRRTDAGFEIHRVTSQFNGRTSEAIGAGETSPTQPVSGETFLFGFSNLFPEGAVVEVARPGQARILLQPQVDFFFTATVVTEAGQGASSNVTIRFPAGKVSRIQNATVFVTIQPQPGFDDVGDVIEAVVLRAPSPIPQ